MQQSIMHWGHGEEHCCQSNQERVEWHVEIGDVPFPMGRGLSQAP